MSKITTALVKRRLREELPEIIFTAPKIREYKIEMTDGTKLAAKAYFPNGEGPWPVVLIRNPYPSDEQTMDMSGKCFTSYLRAL